MNRARSLVVGFLLLLPMHGCASAPVATRASAPAAGSAARAGNDEPVTLAPASQRIIASLRHPLRVVAYVPAGTREHDAKISEVTALLRQYERAGRGNVALEIVTVDSPEQRERAKKAEVSAGALGLVFEYGAKKSTLPDVSVDRPGVLEFWITNHIRSVRDEADGTKRRVGILKGHGELSFDDTNLVPVAGNKSPPTLRRILGDAFPYYQFEDVVLGAGAVDPSLSGIILTQPQTDYTEAELRRIDEFLLRGDKSLVVYASAVNLKAHDPKLLATLSTHGINRLLDGYGIHIEPNAVFDYGAAFELPVQTPNGERLVLRHPGILDVAEVKNAQGTPALDTHFAGFFLTNELMLPFASSLQLWPERQPKDVRLRPLAFSSDEASVDSSTSIEMNLRAHWDHRSPLTRRIVAAGAEGRLTSAFADALKSTASRAPRASRVLVVSSSLFVTNPFAYAGNSDPASPTPPDPELSQIAQAYASNLTSTILTVKNTLDWMTGDGDMVGLSTLLASDGGAGAR